MARNLHLQNLFPIPSHDLPIKIPERYWGTWIQPCKEYPKGIRINEWGMEDKMENKTADTPLSCHKHFTRKDDAQETTAQNNNLYDEDDDENDLDYYDEGDEGDDDEEDMEEEDEEVEEQICEQNNQETEEELLMRKVRIQEEHEAVDDNEGDKDYESEESYVPEDIPYNSLSDDDENVLNSF
jgi:hypothetical protein